MVHATIAIGIIWGQRGFTLSLARFPGVLYQLGTKFLNKFLSWNFFGHSCGIDSGPKLVWVQAYYFELSERNFPPLHPEPRRKTLSLLFPSMGSFFLKFTLWGCYSLSILTLYVCWIVFHSNFLCSNLYFVFCPYLWSFKPVPGHKYWHSQQIGIISNI